jgi:hypothetical protein
MNFSRHWRHARYNVEVMRAARIFLLSLISALAVTICGQAEYPGALWVPANSGNYTVSNRPTTFPINYIVIHVTQGSYAGAISWFQNPNSNVSAHYVLRSSDGQVTQMLKHKDIGYHAGNWNYNTWSIGIEHEGFVSDPSWFTAAIYRSSADLSRYITVRHGIPRTRARIIGHNEVPGATHTDPGPHWNWGLYMELVQHAATFQNSTIPMQMTPGSQAEVVVRFVNSGDVAWMPSGTGQMRLHTQLPPNRNSPFHTTGNWLSPSRPAAVAVNTNPAETGEFRFTLSAPLLPGTYTEAFQLYKDSIGFFGPIVSFQIEVINNSQIVDNVDPGAYFKGGWNTGTTAPGRYGNDYRWADTHPSGTGSAFYFLKGVPNRNYRAYAWWSQGTNRTNVARYILHSGGQWKPKVVLVDQTVNGGKWNDLGEVRMGPGGGYVEISNQAPSGKVVIADAIRFVPVR